MKKVLQIPTADIALICSALQDALAERVVLAPLAPGVAPLADAQLAQLRPETAVILRTSGSTGVPKAVELSSAALLHSAAAAHEALGGPGQWLVALPLEYMGGLGQLVRSVLSGIKPEFALGLSPAELLRRAAAMPHERRYLAVVPVQLGRLLELAAADNVARETLAGMAGVLVGGGPVTLQQRQLAWELGVPLVRTYGASETAGGCVYDGVEIGDTQIRIRDGEVQLAGSCLALGYLGNQEATAAAFSVDAAGTRWYHTGDSGNLLGGMLEVTGRRDRVFISGGVNVSLDRLTAAAAKLLPHPDVVAVAVPDETWGERAVLLCAQGKEQALEGSANDAEPAAQPVALGGAVIAGQDAEQLAAATVTRVAAQLAAELGPAAKPLAVYQLPSLPRLRNGKIDYVSATELAVRLQGTEGESDAH